MEETDTYRPIKRGDVSETDYAYRMDLCSTCPREVCGLCHAVGESTAWLCRNASTACPEQRWPAMINDQTPRDAVWLDATGALTLNSQSRGIGRVTRSLITAIAEIADPDRIIVFAEKMAQNANMHTAAIRDPASEARPAAEVIFSPHERLPAPGAWPLFAYVHDLIPWVVNHDIDYRERMSPLSRFDHLFANSEATRDDFVSEGIARRDQISVVYAGVDPVFRAAGRPVAERRGILNVGGNDPRKGVAELIRAYARLDFELRKQHTLILAFAANRQMRSQIASLINYHELHNRVELVDSPSDLELADLYRTAAVMAFPSSYEGFGLPVAEAMACGCPVVTSYTTSLPEVGGDHLWYIPDEHNPASIAKTLTDCLSHPAKRELWASLSRKHVEQFTWRRTAQLMWKVIANA